MIAVISSTFKYHLPSITSELLEPVFGKYQNLQNGNATEADYTNSLRVLTELLFKSTGKGAMVLIDEYDLPIHSGYTNGYYKEVISFIRSLLGGVLKDNEYLEKGILTGILMIAKEGVFTGLNNLWVYTILDTDFGDKFGFTQEEVDQLLKDYNLTAKSKDIQGWYNGYKFGQTTIYNPWSLLGCASNGGLLEPYWVNTSDNEIIKIFLAKAGTAVKDDFELLLTNKPLEKVIDKKLVFSDIEIDPKALWTLLLFTGYLTYTKLELIEGYIHCNLVIPNREIKFLYKDFLRYFLRVSLKTSTVEQLFTSIKSGDISTFSILLQEFIINSMSMYDLPSDEPERSYHLFVLGLLVLLADVK